MNKLLFSLIIIFSVPAAIFAQNDGIIKAENSKLRFGLKSTCHDYSHVRIPAVCNRERISVPLLINNIDRIVSKYDRFGSEAEFGNKSHRAVINALKRFKEFIDSDYFSKS